MTLTEAMTMLGRQVQPEGCSSVTVAEYQTEVWAFVGYLNSVRAKDTVGNFTRGLSRAGWSNRPRKGCIPTREIAGWQDSHA